MRQGATLVAQREALDLLSFFEDLAGTKPLKEDITVTQSELDTAVTAAITLDESKLADRTEKPVLNESLSSKRCTGCGLASEIVKRSGTAPNKLA